MKSVLLVDTSSSFLKLMEILISRLGFQVNIAHDAVSCLKKTRREQPDLVMCEMNLPDRNGTDLCREIKEDPTLAQVLVMIVTTDGRDQSRQEALVSGCDDYLTKPVTIRPLHHALEQLIGCRRREHLRTSMAIQVEVLVEDERYPLETTNLGEGGAFLKTESPWPAGTILDLSLELPGCDRPFRVQGEVLYLVESESNGQQPGMGVKFITINSEKQRFLSSFIEEYMTRSLPETPSEFHPSARSSLTVSAPPILSDS